VYYSSDSGVTWYLRSTNSAFIQISAYAYLTTLYALTSTGQVYYSANGIAWIKDLASQ